MALPHEYMTPDDEARALVASITPGRAWAELDSIAQKELAGIDPQAVLDELRRDRARPRERRTPE